MDLQVGDVDRDNPQAGATWDARRSLSAEVLTRLLVQHAGSGAPSLRGVRIKGARIVGELNLEAVSLPCPLALENCFFDSPLVLNAASAPSIRLAGSHLPALQARQLVTRGDLDLSGGFTVTQGIDLRGAHIGGRLSCQGSRLANSSGRALDAFELTVDMDVLCNDGFSANGQVALVGAHVGYLDCSGGSFVNPGDQALLLDGLLVDRDLMCNEKFRAEGEVSIIGAHVGGNFHCGSGQFHNPKGFALVADNLIVDQDMFCNDEFLAEGEVSLMAVHVKGELDCSNGRFRNPTGSALSADGITVDQDLFCDDGFTADGTVSLTDACVNGTYQDDPDHWSTRLGLDGFVYGSLSPLRTKPSARWDVPGFSSARVRSLNWWLHGGTAADRLGWLKRNATGYSPQIYEHLASVYRADGSDEEARKVAIAKQRERRRQLSLMAKLWSDLLYVTVGYGYRTWFAALWLLAFLAIGVPTFSAFHDEKLLIAAQPVPQPPPFHPFIYTLDLLLPVVTLHQRDVWIPLGIAQWWFVVFTLAGWVLGTAVVLSLTGLLRKD